MTVVLDASAVLAFVREEPGADRVLAHVGLAVISTVNLQEVIKEMTLDGLTPAQIRETLAGLRLEVRPHDEAASYAAGALVEKTSKYGRGLGDRTCMALGLELGLPILTADQEWKRVKIKGLKLEHIR